MTTSARGRVAYQGRYLLIEVATSAFATDRVRTLLDVNEIHPLTPMAADPALFEWLDLAVALYTLDRSVRIRAGQMGRVFELRLPVADVRSWRRHAPLVTEWYEALTGDLVELVPVERGAQADHHRRPVNLGLDAGADVVGLLSDGLDSLCGADAALRRGDRLALASVITNPLRRATIAKVTSVLERQLGATLPRYALATRMRRLGKGEKSQRSRTVLALVTGLTVARALGAYHVDCYENGFGLLNLPVPDLQYGSMSSQVLNPRHLPLWDRMTRAFFGETIEIRYPNRFRTKAEMVRELSEIARVAARCTSSCDRPLRLPHGVFQCGTCGSCRYRQLAVACAEVPIEDVPYAYQHVGDGPDAERVLRYHAELLAGALAQAEPWPALVALQPELAAVPRSDDGRVGTFADDAHPRRAIESETVALLHRHVDEVRRWSAVHAA
jgi:hypothetical protein